MQISGTNISMIGGDDECITISYEKNGTVIGFVDGDTVYFTMRKYLSDTPIVLQKTITTFTDGKAYIDFASSDTESLGAGTYVYGIRIKFANGKKKTIVPSSEFKISLGGSRE